MNPKNKQILKTLVNNSQKWPVMRDDEWENVVSGLGRLATDKRISGEPAALRNANDRIRWERIYHGDGLSARIAELIPFDETREWIQVRVESDKMEDGQRSEDPDMDIKVRAKIETGVMDKLEALDTQCVIFEARLWARNFGGSLVFLGVDDGGGDDPESMKEPLDVTKIRSFTHLTVFDRFEWIPHTWYTNSTEEKFGLPKTYRMGERNVPGGVSDPKSADLEVHETRFIRFEGVTTTRRRRVNNNGWHDPIWVRLYSLVRDFSQAWGGVAAMLQDFRVAVWKMKGLADALMAGDHDAVIERFRIMNLCVSISQAIPLDADNEDYEKKSTNLSGLPDTLDRFAEQLSAATGYPISILFGRSPAGLNSTGDKDVRQYYDMVRASQKINLKRPIEQIIEMIFLTPDGPTKGKVPEAWSLKFNTLWQLTAKEESDRRKSIAQADALYVKNGVLTPEEVAVSRFGGDEYSIETMLDLAARSEAALVAEAEPEPQELLPVPPELEGDEDREDNFRRRGARDWVVLSNEGSVIGRHTTRTSAQSQIGHILESQGVIVERLSASEWIVVNETGDIVGVHTTRRGAAGQVDEILGRTDSSDGDVDNVFFGKNEKPVAYYAHSMETYGTEIESKDIEVLQTLGYEVVNPNDPIFKDADMEPFLELVRASDIVFSRGTTSGVNYEVHEAHKHDIPVVVLEK